MNRSPDCPEAELRSWGVSIGQSRGHMARQCPSVRDAILASAGHTSPATSRAPCGPELTVDHAGTDEPEALRCSTTAEGQCRDLSTDGDAGHASGYAYLIPVVTDVLAIAVDTLARFKQFVPEFQRILELLFAVVLEKRVDAGEHGLGAGVFDKVDIAVLLLLAENRFNLDKERYARQ
jgi:hypothetical protein